MSPAGAGGADNGNFWAALFILCSGYNIPARLPYCPEGNLSLSWCWWGWLGQLGLVGTGQAGGSLCRGSEEGSCPLFPETSRGSGRGQLISEGVW